MPASLNERESGPWCTFLRRPVLVIPQEVTLVPVIHRRLEEQPAHPQMPHALKSPVCGVDPATHDGEAPPLHLLAEQIIFGEEHALVKSAQLAESLEIKQHEHPGRKRAMQARQVLEAIVRRVEQPVHPISVAAKNVGGDAVQLIALGSL